MILHTASTSSNLEPAGSSHVSSARVKSAQSSAPPLIRPLVAPNMANRTPSDQAVTQALQAVANYPESRGFVETVSRSLTGLQSLIDAPLQLESCMSTRISQGPRPSTTTPRHYLQFKWCNPSQTKSLGVKGSRPTN